MKNWLLTAGTGIVGALFGILTTSYVNLASDKARIRHEQIVNSNKVYENTPSHQNLHIKFLLDEIHNLEVMEPSTIKDLANLRRAYPKCGFDLSEECRPFFVDYISIMRKEFGADKANKNDIDEILKEKYDRARLSLTNQ